MTPHIDPYEAGTQPTGNLWDDLGFTVEEGIDVLSRAALTPAPKTTEMDMSLTPGMMRTYLKREVPWGLIEFEEAPAGWLTQKATPRMRDWRAYHVSLPHQKRERYPSVTTAFGEVIPKDFSRYGEEHGARGAHFLHLHGDLTSEHTEEDAVEMVRERKVGVEAATDRAATRGINVHEFLEEFGKTGEMPKLDVPLGLAGYVKGLQDFLAEYDPEPSATELLVADPDRRLAGRMDMRAVTRSKAMPFRAERVIDLKTSPKLSIWSGAHVQTMAYRLADMKCGGPETDVPIIVVVDGEGRFDVVDCAVSEEAIDAGLVWRNYLKPVDSACQSRNKLARAA